MQKENLTEKKEKILNLDLDTKKEIAKIGMTASLGIVTATSFYMKNDFMKNLHIGSGVALIGFSFWHHMLYQPDKREKSEKIPKKVAKKRVLHRHRKNLHRAKHNWQIDQRRYKKL